MKKKRAVKDVHKQSLADQLDDPETHGVRTKPHKKARRGAGKQADDDASIGAEQSAAILDLARAQQEDEAQLRVQETAGADTRALSAAVKRAHRVQQHDSDADSDWEVADDELGDPQDVTYDDDLVEFSAADEAAFNAFMAPGADAAPAAGGSLLSDMILAKLEAAGQRQGGAEAEARSGRGGGASPSGQEEAGLDETMEQIYTDVGKLLQRYTTGKLPKAFKIVPHLRNWEEVVFTMAPEQWSPHATYAATKMFVSQLNARQTQRFLSLVLLNKVRDDIREHKRLHFALFQAVRKAVFKPGAFYKGFVLPLLKAGDCTLREAVIISSVLNRVSIPVDHSAAALLKMADMPYSGVTSFFMKTLLDKKYSLPYRVVDALVDHFVAFKADERDLPVIWHLSLLTFVQRYKHEIRTEDKESLRGLLKHQFHHGVSPEVLRELNHGASRGQRTQEAGGALPVSVKLGGGRASENLFNMAPVAISDMDF